MNGWLKAAICSAVLLVGTPVFAQPAQPASPPAVSEHKMELAKRYFRAIHYDEIMDQVMKTVMKQMLDSMTTGQPGMTDATKSAIISSAGESVAAFQPQFEQRAITAVA